MSVDDRKNNERIESKITERMLLDISRAAALQDRSLSDYVRLVLRNHLYGHVRASEGECNDEMSRR